MKFKTGYYVTLIYLNAFFKLYIVKVFIDLIKPKNCRFCHEKVFKISFILVPDSKVLYFYKNKFIIAFEVIVTISPYCNRKICLFAINVSILNVSRHLINGISILSSNFWLVKGIPILNNFLILI